MDKIYHDGINRLISTCNGILSKITNSEKKKSAVTTIVLIAWFDLLGKAGKMSGTPRTMPDSVLKEYSIGVLNYLKTIDETLDIDLIEKTLFPININVDTGEIRR